MQEHDDGRLEVIAQRCPHCRPTLLNPLSKCYNLMPTYLGGTERFQYGLERLSRTLHDQELQALM